MNQIKVLIIDDSNVIHVLLEKVISQHKDITIVGDAYDGKEGIEMVKSLSPDVVIMDIGMPRMDGLEAIQEIMNDKPTPIIVFSSSSKGNVDLGFKAIEFGAVHLVEKPSANDLSLLKNSIEENLIKSIRTFADFKVIRRVKKSIITSSEEKLIRLKKHSERLKNKKPEERKENKENRVIKETEYPKIINNFPIIGIASSTGGPQTLRILIEDLSARKIDAALVIVQHMAEGFMQGFRDWLAFYSSMPVLLPDEGDPVKANNIYIAPGEYHLIFKNDGSFSFLDSPPVHGIRPSADIMFNSLGEVFKERAVAVILTGMGNDGTEGLQKVKENNGYIISQDEESSLIFGMPKSAIDSGLVDKVLNISNIAVFLETFCKERFVIQE